MSRDNTQLSGQYRSVEELGQCNPIIEVKQLWNAQRVSVSGKRLNDSMPAIPCGLVAKSFFNDTYKLYKVENGTRREININEKGIAWKTDVESRFKNVALDNDRSWEDIQWLDMTDEHFIVWMRSAAQSSFRKLWGRVNVDLTEGEYYLVI